ncbi:MAG: endonuclease/exonuclease/phosphatase family protein [Pseudomonadota bacterium]
MAGAEVARGLTLVAALLLASGAAAEERLRIASFNTALSRGAPGLLLNDLRRAEDRPRVANIVAILAEVQPDIVLLNEVDHDAGRATLTALAEVLAEAGLDYPHRFSAPVNTGVESGVDLDGDGTIDGPRDAYGFGRYPGHYGMAILSRYPILEEEARTFALLPWNALPGHIMPTMEDGSPWPTAEAAAAMRLSSKSHWDVPVAVPGGTLHLLASHPTPPVFDGPEDRNGRRNHDEIVFWAHYLDGARLADDDGDDRAFDAGRFVILGDLNADPFDGDGRHEGIAGLLAHPRVQDPKPASRGAAQAAETTGGANARHRGDPALDTADWNDERGPGNLRVDYVLPAATLRVLDAGVFWPEPDELGADWVSGDRDATSDHRLVWVDIALPLAASE